MGIFRRRHRRPTAPAFDCECCGARLPGGSTFCRHCGASEESGWGERGEVHEDLGTLDEDFDYEEFVEREFGSTAGPNVSWRGIVVILILLGFLLAILLPMF